MIEALGWHGLALLAAIGLLAAALLWLNDRTVERWWLREPHMRGNRGLRRAWRWKGTPPRAVKCLASAFLINLVTSFALFVSISQWADVEPHGTRNIPVQLRGGRTYYAAPLVGHYFNYSVPFGFIILISAGIVMWRHREQLERIA